MNRQGQLDFIERVAPAAQASHAEHGISASVTIAQAILESGWGESQLALDGKNLFGIKARQGEDYVEFKTAEFRSGRKVTEPARFRRFKSYTECFNRHAELLSNNARYRIAMAFCDDPLAFALKLQLCGYSTNPQYATLLAGLIEQFNLARFDAKKETA